MILDTDPVNRTFSHFKSTEVPYQFYIIDECLSAAWWGVAQRFVLLRNALVCKHLSHFGMQFKNIWFSKVVHIYALSVALQKFSSFPPQLNLYNLLQQHVVELILMIWCQEKCLRITHLGQHESKISKMYVQWVDDTIRDIEIQSGKKVVKFYIGKTYVRKNKKSKVFDAMNPNTWRKEGIRSRWCHHKHQDYGRNGMVVLTVVTKDDVPQQRIPAFKHQEMYALALEQQLIIHYAFISGDERLANTSTHPGMKQ